MRLNVSKGPQPVLVPTVVGEPFDQAASELQATGLQGAAALRRRHEPANTVIGQSPSAGGTAGKGLGRLAHRLEGAEDLDGAGRDELRPRLGASSSCRRPASNGKST